MPELDDTDCEIIHYLQQDSRMPFSEIADRIGLSPPTISQRVERLHERGLIGFGVDVDDSVETVEIPRRKLGRLVIRADADRQDPGEVWTPADEEAYREAVEKLGIGEPPVSMDDWERISTPLGGGVAERDRAEMAQSEVAGDD